VKLNGNCKWAISPDVRPTYSQDGAVVLHIEQGRCYSLNLVAAQILLAIESSPNGISLDGIVGAVETRFEGRPPEFADDIAECVAELQQMELIHSNDHSVSKAAGQGRK
jgi:hypothetical protein